MTSCARRAVAAVVGAMVLAACVGDRGGAGRTSDPPDPGSARAFRGDGAPLQAGVYRHPTFRPPFTFRLGEGWEGGHDHAEFFDVWHGSDVTVGFARPSFVRGIDGRIDADGLTPRVALSTIASRGRAGPVRAASLGGRPAAEMSFHVDRVIAVFGGEDGE